MKQRIPPKITGFIVIILLILLLSAESFAKGARWWNKWRVRNDQKNRYEGLIEIPVHRAGGLELLSFIGFLEPFSNDVTLKVKYFVPSNFQSRYYILVTGRELRDKRHYWMESYPQKINKAWHAGKWNEFGPWQTSKVLRPEDIPDWNLGVVILLRERANDELAQLLPAFVYHSKLPVSINKYSWVLRPDRTLRSVVYSLYKFDANKEEKLMNPATLSGDRIEGEPFRINLAAENIPEGQLKLVVHGPVKHGKGKVYEEFIFHHKAQIE